MKKTFLYLFLIVISGCSVNYNFTGTGKIDAKTFQVNYFLNNAPIVEPGIERTFTVKLQDLINNQTNLSLVSNNGDLIFEGEITDYRIAPQTATADQGAAQNRMTINVKVKFTNRKKEDDNFEKTFTHFYIFQGNDLPTGSVLKTGLDQIYERITQDIFNEALAKW